jgi:dinuclear metal center YbgI/SA1388 family protein
MSLTREYPQLGDIVSYLDAILPRFVAGDSAQNGLQVEARPLNTAVATVGVAVDGALSIIERAGELDVDLLIVHHGIFWGSPLLLTGRHAHRCRLLFRHGCSLYASHLPLDGHQLYGNGALLSTRLELEVREPFCEAGTPVGVIAGSPFPLLLSDLEAKLHSRVSSRAHTTLPYGPKQIGKVAVITGSGTSLIHSCHLQGIDTLITGEPKHGVYHDAKEYRMNVLCAGHYATETFGVRKLGSLLQEQWNLQVHFIDEDSGI